MLSFIIRRIYFLVFTIMSFFRFLLDRVTPDPKITLQRRLNKLNHFITKLENEKIRTTEEIKKYTHLNMLSAVNRRLEYLKVLDEQLPKLKFSHASLQKWLNIIQKNGGDPYDYYNNWNNSFNRVPVHYPS